MTYLDASRICWLMKQQDMPQDDIQLVRAALYKQVPTRVQKKHLLGTYRGISIYYAECPNCKKGIGSESCKIVCDQCGQILYWG